MALYEFFCPDCKTDKEVLQKFTDAPPVCETKDCVSHAKPMRKKISRSSFELKGSGWAKDGYGG